MANDLHLLERVFQMFQNAAIWKGSKLSVHAELILKLYLVAIWGTWARHAYGWLRRSFLLSLSLGWLESEEIRDKVALKHVVLVRIDQ